MLKPFSHIILDSNVYLGDLTFSGVRFAALYDYLKKTKATLVLPRMVREEVIADYLRQLKAAAKKVYEVWGTYRSLMLSTSVQPFRMPDLKQKENDIRRAFDGLGNRGVGFLALDQIKDIDIDELWKRGVRRIRPANEQGEELRDVLIWLIALKFSANVSTPVAFISTDKGFWAKDKAHEVILKDIQEGGSNVFIFQNLEEFSTVNALSSRPLEPKQMKSLVSDEKIVGPLTEGLQAALQGTQVTRNHSLATLRDPRLLDWNARSGVAYAVGDDAEFGEWEVELSAEVQVLTPPWIHIPTGSVEHRTTLSNFASGNVFKLTFPRPVAYLDTEDAVVVGGTTWLNPGWVNVAHGGQAIFSSSSVLSDISTSVTLGRVQASCRVLTRLEKGTVTEIEVSEMKIEKFHDLVQDDSSKQQSATSDIDEKM